MDESAKPGPNPHAEPLAAKGRRRLRPPKRKRIDTARLFAISFLPSLITLFSLFLGFRALLSIVRGDKGDYLLAITFTAICVVLDGFDGTIARLTKTESNFGVQLDSLNDAVTFGVSMAAMIYFWGFKQTQQYTELGAVVAFVFLAAGLIRLARFNVYKEAKLFAPNIFIGLPIPVAALSICSWVLLFKTVPKEKSVFALLFALYSVLISLLMVSNIHYRTIKNFNLKKHLPVLLMLAIAVGLAIIYPFYTLPVITTIYILSPLLNLAKKGRSRGEGGRSHPVPETAPAADKSKSGIA